LKKNKHEDPRIPGQGDPPEIRSRDAAGVPCFSVEEAVAATRELGGKVWVVKAQIHAGGRGKGAA